MIFFFPFIIALYGIYFSQHKLLGLFLFSGLYLFTLGLHVLEHFGVLQG